MKVFEVLSSSFLPLSQLSRGKTDCICVFCQPFEIVVLMSHIKVLRLKLQHQRGNYRLVMTSVLRSSKINVEFLFIDHQMLYHRFYMTVKI